MIYWSCIKGVLYADAIWLKATPSWVNGVCAQYPVIVILSDAYLWICSGEIRNRLIVVFPSGFNGSIVPGFEWLWWRTSCLLKLSSSYPTQLSQLSYEERLSRLGLTPLEERRTRGDMIQTYKILHGIDIVGKGTFLQLTGQNHPNTRGHSLKLNKPRFRISHRNKFFNARIVNKWNSLPENIVMSHSVNIFKNRYDQLKTLRQRRGTLYEHWLLCLFNYH